jgi:hypothetical protein
VSGPVLQTNLVSRVNKTVCVKIMPRVSPSKGFVIVQPVIRAKIAVKSVRLDILESIVRTNVIAMKPILNIVITSQVIN